MMTKTKRICTLFLALMMLFSITAMAETMNISAAYDFVSVRVNGSYINAPSYLYNNNVYVPLRAVSEAMGAEVLWDSETKGITITTNATEPKAEPRAFSLNTGEDLSLEVYINYVKLAVDGKELLIPHFLHNGTTYVPVSVFYDHFGCHVMQHQATMSVRIYEPDYVIFGENEVLYVNSTPYTKTEISDISNVIAGNPTPATLMDYVYVEEFLLNAQAVKTLGEQIVPAEGFSEYYTANNYDNLIATNNVENKEAFIKNVIWPMYYSQSINEETFGSYLNPTDADLEAFLANSSYGTGRWLKAKHILINKTEDGSGLEQAKEILAFVKENPEKFDSMMATYSQDPSSITQPDGYLFQESDMVTEFYESTLPLQVGEISDIVESQYGYHIILKVADYENGLPLDEVKEEIQLEYLSNSFNNMMTKQLAETDTVLNRAAVAEK